MKESQARRRMWRSWNPRFSSGAARSITLSLRFFVEGRSLLWWLAGPERRSFRCVQPGTSASIAPSLRPRGTSQLDPTEDESACRRSRAKTLQTKPY